MKRWSVSAECETSEKVEIAVCLKGRESWPTFKAGEQKHERLKSETVADLKLVLSNDRYNMN